MCSRGCERQESVHDIPSFSLLRASANPCIGQRSLLQLPSERALNRTGRVGLEGLCRSCVCVCVCVCELVSRVCCQGQESCAGQHGIRGAVDRYSGILCISRSSLSRHTHDLAHGIPVPLRATGSALSSFPLSLLAQGSPPGRSGLTLLPREYLSPCCHTSPASGCLVWQFVWRVAVHLVPAFSACEASECVSGKGRAERSGP